MHDQVKRFLEGLAGNAWRWGLAEFAATLGRTQDDPWAREKFLEFRQLTAILGRFDDELMWRLSRPADDDPEDAWSAEDILRNAG